MLVIVPCVYDNAVRMLACLSRTIYFVLEIAVPADRFVIPLKLLAIFGEYLVSSWSTVGAVVYVPPCTADCRNVMLCDVWSIFEVSVCVVVS